MRGHEMQQAVITGGAGALGQAVARALQDPGWEILTPGRLELDVRDSGAISLYFQHHAPELLVCAAGRVRDAPIARISEQDWDELMAVNFTAAAACARAVLPGMVGRNRGHILFVSSFSALHPPAGQLGYATAKAALLGLTAELAVRHGPDNVRVNCILPGFMDTPMTAAVSAQRRQKILAAHALSRLNTVTEVAKFIRHLHHELPHTSGQVFQLDSRVGGR
jgi:3-oxoacyl-[acyl-carrier protein] reductase